MHFKDEPDLPGLYVAYVDDDHIPNFAANELLIWHENRWWRRPGTVKWRGHVYGCIGPLPALELTDGD